MSLQPEQKKFIQGSFRQIASNNQFAEQFYHHLFVLDPASRDLFSSDMTEQCDKFMQTISVIVGSLNDINILTPSIKNLGRRHARYQVTPEQWKTVKIALLKAIEETLGADYRPDVAQAWGDAYDLIADIAIKAGYE